jgi:hypothetical protein
LKPSDKKKNAVLSFVEAPLLFYFILIKQKKGGKGDVV